MNKYELAAKAEKEMEYYKWVKLIPDINFKSEWNVRPCPSYGGAVVRFFVSDKRTIKNKSRKHVSIYLDCYSMLGGVDEPYWEVYPCFDGTCGRCLINEKEELVSLIQESLDWLAENE